MRGFYVTVTAVTLGLWIAMSFVVPSVVMDEVFHAGQARVYALSSNWLRAPYHPALTTPPGLYWTSPSVLFGAFLLPALRSTNALYGLGTGALLHSLVAVNRRTSNAKHQPKTSQEAFTLWLFPLSFFFHFLYYTDSGSTFWMLLGLLQTRRGAYTLAALSCVLGMTFRQTNVIWTAYFCGLGVIQVLQGTPGGPNVKKTRSKMAFRDIPVHSFSQASHQLYAFIQAIILNISSLILKLWGFLIALSSFAVFVWHNGGIVLGDKSNHVSAFHLPQLYYFSAFTAILTLSHLEPLKCATELVTKGVSLKGLIKFSLISLLIAWTVSRFTIEHPFLLADNRHFTFYLWRWVYRSYGGIGRYVLIPGYICAAYLLIRKLFIHTGFIASVGYIAATILALVPSPLLEFRYFIIAFYIYRLSLPPGSISSLAYERTLYVLINGLAFGLFFLKPFEWPQNPGEIQRFMW